MAFELVHSKAYCGRRPLPGLSIINPPPTFLGGQGVPPRGKFWKIGNFSEFFSKFVCDFPKFSAKILNEKVLQS